LELLDQPDIIMPYTFKEDIAKIKITPKLMSAITIFSFHGKTLQTTKLSINVKTGAPKNINQLAEEGIIVSLNTSLIPSTSA